jgi:hypothetical protein
MRRIKTIEVRFVGYDASHLRRNESKVAVFIQGAHSNMECNVIYHASNAVSPFIKASPTDYLATVLRDPVRQIGGRWIYP